MGSDENTGNAIHLGSSWRLSSRLERGLPTSTRFTAVGVSATTSSLVASPTWTGGACTQASPIPPGGAIVGERWLAYGCPDGARSRGARGDRRLRSRRLAARPRAARPWPRRGGHRQGPAVVPAAR